MITEISIGATVLTNGQWWCQNLQAGYPGISHTIINRGNYHGSKVYPGKFTGQQIVSEWLVVGTSFSDLADQREAFRMAVSRLLARGEETLRVTKSNGVVLTIPIKAAKLTGDIQSEDGLAGRFLVTFIAEYPFFRSLAQKSQDMSIFSGGGMAIPMGIPMDMSAGGSGEFEVTNVGEYDAFPVFTFTGILDNPTITNVTTGEQLSVAYTLASEDDQIVVDTYERSAILLPAGNNARQYISGDFLTIVPGMNALRLTAGSYNEQGTVTVAFYDTYLGV